MPEDLRVILDQWKELRERSAALQRESRELRLKSKEIRQTNAILADDLRVIRASTLFVNVKALQEEANKANGHPSPAGSV